MNKINKVFLFSVGIVLLLAIFFIANYYQKPNPVINNQVIDNEQEEELKSKIGQMIIFGFRGSQINDNSFISKAIKDLNLGGVILFDYDLPSKGEIERNIVNPEQTKNLISSLKEIDSSIFVAVDAEGGYVNRLKEKYGFEEIPSAGKMGGKDPEETLYYGDLLGKELNRLGFNMNFAPVVDLNINTENPVIGGIERAFSQDPEMVTIHAFNFIKGLNQNGIISVIKHFPGHGSSQNDSHLGMVDITKTYQEKELLPYKNLLATGYSGAIMTAHVINKNIDPDYPATLSPLFLKDILRKEIGFKGVIVSDDMQMEAIGENYGGLEEAAVKSINAGCDILIVSNNGSYYDEESSARVVEAIFKAVKEGRIKESQINESFARIINLKKEFNI
jgi:beta-N-acetylhexosaminidase